MASAVHGLTSRWCWGGTRTAAGHIGRIFATEVTKHRGTKRTLQMAAWTIPCLHAVLPFVISVVTIKNVSNGRISNYFK
jgi:hypothetical protein